MTNSYKYSVTIITDDWRQETDIRNRIEPTRNVFNENDDDTSLYVQVLCVPGDFVYNGSVEAKRNYCLWDMGITTHATSVVNWYDMKDDEFNLTVVSKVKINVLVANHLKEDGNEEEDILKQLWGD